MDQKQIAAKVRSVIQLIFLPLAIVFSITGYLHKLLRKYVYGNTGKLIPINSTLYLYLRDGKYYGIVVWRCIPDGFGDPLVYWQKTYELGEPDKKLSNSTLIGIAKDVEKEFGKQGLRVEFDPFLGDMHDRTTL
jgi:hypothetical protein